MICTSCNEEINYFKVVKTHYRYSYAKYNGDEYDHSVERELGDDTPDCESYHCPLCDAQYTLAQADEIIDWSQEEYEHCHYCGEISAEIAICNDSGNIPLCSNGACIKAFKIDYGNKDQYMLTSVGSFKVMWIAQRDKTK